MDKWISGDYVPLFVSEGTSEQKVKSIQNSFYLNTVFREVLPVPMDSLVIYGWGLGEQDEHILSQIEKSGIEKVAVSVYKNNQAYCNDVENVFLRKFSRKIQLEFFDSESSGCWIHP